MGAVVNESQPSWVNDLTGVGAVSGTSLEKTHVTRPAAWGDLDRFKREVLKLGLVRDEEIRRFVAGAPEGVLALARALVFAGKLTPSQAVELSSGEVRELVVGNYFLLDKLGAGGMGVVFKARHRRLGRVVALKILPPMLAQNPQLLSRFRREVDVAASLSHPNLVSVLDADEDHGVQFMTMEYIQGNDLDRLVRDGGALPVDLALDCVIQAGRGLQAVHAQGIVHRDIKPGNLMIDNSGRVRVLDLGLARLIEAANPSGETSQGALTRSGTYMGTVDFMAPEQGIDSSRVDHRADIYSLGCTFCYLLTGRAPFGGTNVLSRMMAHQDQAAGSLRVSRPEVSRPVDAAYQRMMAKKPSDRPGSMTEVITMLEACRSSNGEALTALKQFATTVTLMRSSPEGTVPNSSSLGRDAPGGARVKPEPTFDREPRLEEVSPASSLESTIVTKSASNPDHAGSFLARAKGRRKSLAMVVGALMLVAMGCFGYGLIPSKRQPVATQDRPSPPAPRSSTTFDVATLYSLYGENGREGSVDTIAVTADGHRALVGGWTEYAVMINIDTGTRLDPAIGSHRGWQGAAPRVAMTPDGRRALIGTLTVRKDNLGRIGAKEAGILWFWNLTTGQEFLPKQQPYHGPVTAVAISPDGLIGLSASREGELTLWDLKTGERRAIGPQQGDVSSHAMVFFPDGRRVATGGRDQLVHIWDVDTGRDLAAWPGHEKTISGLAISADGRQVATGSHDGTVILWDVARGAILHRFEMPTNDKGARVAFDSEGNVVAAGNGVGETSDKPGKPGNVIVWDAKTFAELRRNERPLACHMALATLPGGRVLTGDRYGLRLWTPRPSGGDAGESPPGVKWGEEPVDLIGMIKPQSFKIGEWHVRGGELVSPTTGGARLEVVPNAPPSEYQIDMEVERGAKEADYSFGLGFVVEGRQTEITVDKHVDQIGRCTGLSGVDGAPVAHGPKFHLGPLLAPSRPAQFSLTVRRKSIKLTCDGTSVLDWSGDPRRLIRYVRWHIPDPRSIFLATTSSVKFRKMILTPLKPQTP